MLPVVTTGEAAKRLGIPEPRLRDLLRRGKIPEPGRIGNRRVWTDDELAAAKVYVKRNA